MKTLSAIVASVFLLFGVSFADAAAVKKPSVTKATLVTTLPTLTLKPGETKTISVQFKNAATEVWENSGAEYVSMYVDPSTYKSPFYNKKWVAGNQVVKMKEKSVKKGGLATFDVVLTAPKKEGMYQEKFKLAVENTEWIDGSYFTLPIRVGAEVAKVVAVKEAVPEKSSLSGILLIKSAPIPAIAGGEMVNIQLGFKNNGLEPWKHIKLVEPGFSVATAETSPFFDTTWPAPRVAAMLTPEEEYVTGRMAIVSANVRAPRAVGSYTMKFQLSANGVEVPGTLIEIPMEVASPGNIEVSTAVSIPAAPPAWTGVKEPLMRVGLTMLEQAIVSVNSTYRIMDGNGREYGVMNTGEQATIVFDAGTLGQQVTHQGAVYTTDTYFRLVPQDAATGIFTIQNYENRPNWNLKLNDNQYRGTFEMRRNTAGYVWLVNELPLENYVAGIAEASNPWPLEFHKALAIATRSYADYYIIAEGKHRGSSHYLNASSVDQVYKGYGAEIRNPRFVESVRATRGMVIRYNGTVAFASFYSRSDGMTRSHKAVYGREVPYLVARPAEYDAKVGKSLWGHGVGMPMTDAALRAEAGATFDQILNAYYTGITIDRVFE